MVSLRKYRENMRNVEVFLSDMPNTIYKVRTGDYLGYTASIDIEGERKLYCIVDCTRSHRKKSFEDDILESLTECVEDGMFGEGMSIA